MQSFISAFRVAKIGNQIDECEDAYAVAPTVPEDEIVDSGPIVVTVSDGASESLLSGSWADILATSLTKFVYSNIDLTVDRTSFARAVGVATEVWNDWLVAYVAERERASKPIRWYEKPKLDKGSHAAVLTVAFTEASDGVGRWSACALGDVCMFHVSNDVLVEAFPLSGSNQFDSSPLLIGTQVASLELVSARASAASGFFESGDQFFIGTDAFSAWFLHQWEKQASPWDLLRDLTFSSTDGWFEGWTQEVRSSGEMRNDDIAVVHVDMG